MNVGAKVGWDRFRAARPRSDGSMAAAATLRDMSLRVGVFGVGGRMGRAVAEAVLAEPELDLVAAVDPSYEGIDIAEVANVEGVQFDVSANALAMVDANVDVTVDFTTLAAARKNLAFCAEHGIHSVVGTSGFTEAEFDDIREMFTSSNCLIAANFAIGGVLMTKFAEMAAPFFETGEIIEFHHDTKLDSPSGTAVYTAERMAAASDTWADDPTESETIPGGRGAVGAGGIPIHAVRMRGMTAHQEVVLGSTGQTLTLRHDSFDRSSFMPGVVLAVKRVGDMPGLTTGLEEALGV